MIADAKIGIASFASCFDC